MYRNANIIVEIGCRIALRNFYIAPRYQDFTYICNGLTNYVTMYIHHFQHTSEPYISLNS